MTATAGIEISFSGDIPEEGAETPVVTPTVEAQVATGAQTWGGPAGSLAPTTVSTPTPRPTNTPPRGLKAFEEAPVNRTEIKLAGATAVNTNDGIEISLDDRIRVVGEFRVSKVTHYVDQKTGDVVRQQTIVAVNDLELTPFDPGDPNDDGIVRVRS